MERAYRIAGAAIIHELLDQEIIIANLSTGNYYSLRQTAVPVWQLLLANYTAPQILQKFTIHYSLSSSETDTFLGNFIETLIEEALLVTVDAQVKELPLDDLIWPESFTQPAVEKFEEMSQLLTLDPIHEVAEQGWPVKADVTSTCN